MSAIGTGLGVLVFGAIAGLGVWGMFCEGWRPRRVGKKRYERVLK